MSVDVSLNSTPSACMSEDSNPTNGSMINTPEELTTTKSNYGATGERVRKIGKWIVGETLGEGGFSKVRVGIHETTGERVALKLLKTDALKLTPGVRKQVEAEITALSKLQNPHVTRFFEVDWNAQYEKSNGTIVPVILVVLELVTGGELFEFLSATGCFEEAIARAYFHQLVEGVAYCHSHGIVHRDLKPENILLDRNFQLKLADFGFAAAMNESRLMFTNCGTPTYMAPEMFTRGRGYEPTACDVWALGVILFIMLAGFPPFQQPSPNDWWFQKLMQSRHSLFWAAHTRNAYFSENAKDLINKILCVDSAQRITLEGIRNHPWFCEATMPEAALHRELSERKKKVNEAKERKEVERRMQRMQRGAQSGDSIISDTYRGDDDLPDLIPALKYTFSDEQKQQQPTQGLDQAVDDLGAELEQALSFVQQEVNQSAKESTQQQVSASTVQMPAVTGPAPDVSTVTNSIRSELQSTLSADVSMSRVASFLASLKAQIQWSTSWHSLRFDLQTTRGSVSMAVSVYSVGDKDSDYAKAGTQSVLVFQRRNNTDYILFRSVFTQLSDQLSAVL